MRLRAAAVAAFLGLISVACSSGPPQLLAKQTLFTLSLGTLDNQIDLFDRPNGATPQTFSFQFANGLFLVSDGNARKVMEFSSYGDLLSLYYNPDDNPIPSLMDSPSGTEGADQVKNRRAFPYPFRELGQIAVTAHNQLYVEDRIPLERRTFDSDLVAVLQSRILRFDPEGHFLDFLGQEGIGGTPFPALDSLTEVAKGELVVVARGGKGWEVWWYDSSGTLLTKAFLTYAGLPFPRGDAQGAPQPQLEALIPDWNKRVVFVKIDYYREIEDPTTKTALDVQVSQSRIWRYDLDKKAYVSSYAIPVLKRQRQPNEVTTPTGDRPFAFLGVDSAEYGFFLSSPEGGKQRFLVLHPDGTTALERNIAVDQSAALFGQYQITPDGMLVGFLSDGNGAQLAWWRSDKLLGSYATSGL